MDDLLDQVRDYFEVLKGVEEAIADDGKQAIEWRIVRATTNSPILLEAAPFSRVYAVSVDARAEMVARQTAHGFRQLQSRRERPSYFSNRVLARVERIFERVTNGLDQTTIDYGVDLPATELTPALARVAIANTRAVLRPESKPYREQGSVEGYAQSIERDGHGRPILHIRHRLTGDPVKCLVSGPALAELEAREIRHVFRGQRVLVYGVLSYRSLGQLSQIDATEVRFLRDRSQLPDLDDVADENFTGGLGSAEYLARLRDGSLS